MNQLGGTSMDPRHNTSTELEVLFVTPEGERIPLTAELSYTSTDPYAVRMTFSSNGAEPVEWIFARELLVEGLKAPFGPCDVVIAPSAIPVVNGEQVQYILNIGLSSPFGYAQFETLTATVVAFLARTYAIVPLGLESAVCDWDKEIAELLKREASS
jgi:sporulation and cell division protein SsgA